MYNKLFTKILDSTIWLENDATRLVWITFLAVMDEDGFAALSSVGNVASRARVSPEDAEAAIRTLEGPDKLGLQQENQGKRIERVPYGWVVLNSKKYREFTNREIEKGQNRARVARFRARQKDARVMLGNANVMQAETEAETKTEETNTPPPIGDGPDGPQNSLSTEKTKKGRRRDPLWDAWVAKFYKSGVSPSERSKVGKEVRDLHSKGATPEDIPVVVAGYKAIFDNCVCTAAALVKHWDDAKNGTCRPSNQESLGRIRAPEGKYANARVFRPGP